MKYTQKRIYSFILVVVVTLSSLGIDESFTTTAIAKTTVSVTTSVKSVDKSGNLVLKISRSKLYKAGFSKNDIVNVKIGSRKTTYIMPIYAKSMIWGKTYLDVKNKTIKITRQDRSFAEREHETKAKGRKVVITLVKKKGYSLSSPTDQISDYSDNENTFANFRTVEIGKIGENKLYRSYSPVSESGSYGGRCAYVNKLMDQNDIKSVITLNLDTDDLYEEADESISAFYLSMYEDGNVSAVKISGGKIASKQFRNGLASHIRFMLDHEGPYLVHCAIGRDRTGFTIALLAALMGASYDEIAEDYVMTYRNYNHVKKGTAMDKYLKTSINDTIQEWTGSGGKYVAPKSVDLETAATRYLKKVLGFTDDEIKVLKGNLS